MLLSLPKYLLSHRGTPGPAGAPGCGGRGKAQPALPTTPPSPPPVKVGAGTFEHFHSLHERDRRKQGSRLLLLTAASKSNRAAKERSLVRGCGSRLGGGREERGGRRRKGMNCAEALGLDRPGQSRSKQAKREWGHARGGRARQGLHG